MFNRFFSIAAVLASLNSYAQVDYSRYNFAAGLYFGMSLAPDGSLNLGVGQKLHTKTTNGNVEKYVIDTEAIGYKGFSVSTGMSRLEISLVKDDRGRVIRIINGGDAMDKKTLEKLKQYQLQMQVASAVSNADWTNGRVVYGGGNYTDIPGPTLLSEPTYSVADDSGKQVYLKLSQLNDKQKAEVGLSEDVYRALKQRVKKDKRTVDKFKRDSYLSARSKPAYYIGQEAELEIKNGVSVPVKVNTRTFHSKDETIHSNPTFSKEACEEVARLHQKHQEKVTKCDEANSEIFKDIFANAEKLKTLSGGGGFGYPRLGFGVYGMGYGGYGFTQQSPLSMMKNQCAQMLGDQLFVPGVGYPVPARSSSALEF